MTALAPTPDSAPTLLSVRGLTQVFRLGRRHHVTAIGGVDFEIRRGETFGLVGESGSGKSTIGRSIIRLIDPTDGQVVLAGRTISGRLDAAQRDHLRSSIQMIFQNPMSSLNPRKTVFDIVAQGLTTQRRYSSAAERDEKVYAILEKVGLDRSHADRYPHQFSGGQRQRIGIARALVMQPDLVIADECVSALDVSIQAQVVNLMRALQEELGTAYLFIAHDLAMVKYISDRIGVMHKGHLVETGTTAEIFSGPVHPYTRSLLRAVLSADPRAMRRRAPSEPYDPVALGIDYSAGSVHELSPTHRVLATPEELAAWRA
ncbi:MULTISPECIES: ABC transporter ATP-binding protein [unclassified Rathayibacter]|uniref:ATP-binding cassette domain-containing protein n=1 Tax=unclassified Rathayibacter TaxID=2609250 RepID=UPI000CE79C42|nr:MULTISPECIES: ABC transporter ATP-binding protein [unclassified Rathayibacter]PPG06694.1 peptide ABC transporter ATP-binding protein [Rathayibacter sp. AY2B1]PPG70195.1 peptide ABC transporter ATP-binding protein [Rathayibacter sp. AY1F4]